MSRVMTRQRIAAFLLVGLAIAALIGFSALRGESRAQLASTAEPVDGAVFVLSAEEPHLLALRLGDGRPLGRIEVDSAPDIIAATPGGVSLFLGWNDRHAFEVYDVLTLEYQATLDSAEPRPTAISFSPTGEQLFVLGDSGRRLTVLAHSRLTLDKTETYPVSAGDDAVLSNRRATRLFRPTPAGLDVHFAQGGQLLDRFQSRGFGWRFDRDHVELWGIERDGRPIAIDERDGESRVIGGVAVADHPPVVNDRITYLSRDGLELISFDPRAVQRRPQRVALPRRAEHLVATGPNDVWAFSRDGLLMMSAQQGVTTRDLSDEGIAPIRRVVAAVVQQGGGFACFD